MVRDQAYEPGAGSNVQTGRLDKAQTFTVGTTGTLARVDVDILRYPGSASDLLFDLRATINGAPVASNTNTLVSVRVPHSQVPTTRGFFSINFQNSGVPVTAGTVLAIVLRSDPDVQSYTWFGTHSSNAYPQGHHYFRHPPGWPRPYWYGDVSGTDMGFRTYLMSSTPPPAGTGQHNGHH